MRDSTEKFRVTVAVLATLVAAFLAVSADSLWIDEAFSAHFAVAPDLAGWWRTLKATGPPDVQMPLYMGFLWAWEKLFGSSEWALRAANIPWFLLAQAAYWVGLRRWPRLQLAAVLCGACDPFLWRYFNEARPYAMQYSGAAVVVSCLAWLAGESGPVLIGGGWLFAFGGGLFVLCASVTLGIPWAGAAVLSFLCLAWRGARIARSLSAIAVCAAWVLALGGLAAYDVWTSGHTPGGTLRYDHRLGTLCFAAYELLGFTGLGPSRISVTEEHEPSVFFPFIGSLTLFAILLAGMVAFAVRAFFSNVDTRRAWAAVSYLAPPLLILSAIAIRRGWHATGRHFTPASPVIVLTVALAIAAAWREKSRWRVGWTGAFLLVWLISSLEVRFAMRHRRDDYRDAARTALTALAQGKHVWWVAADLAGRYYHLPLTGNPRDAARAYEISCPKWPAIADLPAPDEVFLSKPPIFDPSDNVTAYLRLHHYHPDGELPAFTIWEK